MSRSKSKSFRSSFEVLEARIAPAAVAFPTILQAEQQAEQDPPNRPHRQHGTVGTPVLLTAGDLFTTGQSGSGEYLLFVQQGEALVFTTDLNNNGVIDPNEITGIAAGDGLRLISFVDIHGDIVTDLNANGTLSNSPGNSNFKSGARRRRITRVLLNNSIDMIEFRSLTPADILPTETLSQLLVPTNYSLYGNILAGKSFGTATGGLVIDTSESGLIHSTFNGSALDYFPSAVVHPTFGGIFTGSAASGQFFSFGLARAPRRTI